MSETNPETWLREGWLTVGRPGYVGGRRRKQTDKLDRQFGSDNWRVCHLWKGQPISRDEALVLYEDAYFAFLNDRRDVLDWLCEKASDVYDIAPSNVESGLDYFHQECAAVHLQDIAVRRCLKRLGRSFEGDHLVQIRGYDSEGYRLNPGQVPFHRPQEILKPSLRSWWNEESIEDFWQSNKLLQVRDTVPEPALKDAVLKPLTSHKGEAASVAILGGSFNPIHLGHLRIARELVDLFGFAKIIFVPNGNHYRKRGLIDEEHRARMVVLAIAGEPGFELSRFELGRDKVIYTVETMTHLREELGQRYDKLELYNVRGSDNIGKMLRWKSAPALLEVTQIVPVRPGSDPWQAFGQDERFRLHCDRFRLMERSYEDGLSSTEVRERIRRTGSARFLVPDAVDEYIRENGLYQDR